MQIFILVVFGLILWLPNIIRIIKWYESRFDSRGFNKNSGIHRNGTKYDDNGFDRNGYDRNGYNQDGFDKYGYNKDGFDKNGFDKNGYNPSGFDKNGYDKDGYDRDGFNKYGYNASGYNKSGYNTKGVSKDWRSCYGFACEDYYNEEYDEYGFNKFGICLKTGYSSVYGIDKQEYHNYNRYCGIDVYEDYIVVNFIYFVTQSVENSMVYHGWEYNPVKKIWLNSPIKVDFAKFINFVKYNARNQTFISFKKHNGCFIDKNGYDVNGFNAEGYDKAGYNSSGYNKHGYNRDGFNIAGYDKYGCNKEGLNHLGLPKCCSPFRYSNCFAINNNGCNILTTTDFKEDVCSFYKSKETLDFSEPKLTENNYNYYIFTEFSQLDGSASFSTNHGRRVCKGYYHRFNNEENPFDCHIGGFHIVDEEESK